MNPLWKKLKGFDITISVIDGHNLEEIRLAASKKTKNVHIVFMKTIKGKGISFMENKMEWHYLPLDEEKYKDALKAVGSMRDEFSDSINSFSKNKNLIFLTGDLGFNALEKSCS